MDCRQANALLKRPPATRLATPASLASLDFSPEALTENGFEVEDSGSFSWGADTGDVGDCFYNFAVPKACSWFSTGDVTSGRELGLRGHVFRTFFDEDSETDQPLDPDEPVYICWDGVGHFGSAKRL